MPYITLFIYVYIDISTYIYVSTYKQLKQRKTLYSMVFVEERLNVRPYDFLLSVILSTIQVMKQPQISEICSCRSCLNTVENDPFGLKIRKGNLVSLLGLNLNWAHEIKRQDQGLDC